MSGAMMDDQLERNVLGCILSGADIPPVLDAGMFASIRNRIVFKAIATMKDHDGAPDIVTLPHYLQSIGKLDEAGGATYVASLTDGVFPSQIEFFTETQVKRCRDRKYETAIRLAAENIGKEPTEWIVQDLQNKIEAQAPDLGGGLRFDRVGGMGIAVSPWLVKGLFETDFFGDLFGDPGAGKSFLAIELAACVATGTSFYGLQVKHPGPVIYIAGEGRTGLIRRFRAWSITRGVSLDSAPLFLNSGAVSLIDDASMVSVVKALKVLIKEIGRPPALAILDTWSRTLGGDDSDPSDGAAGVASLDALRARFDNFATLVVHHEGHLKGRARGWSGLHAAVDVEFRAVRGKDNLLRMECTKSKDTRPIDPMAFQFAGVDLEITDEDGDPVASAILNRVDYTSAPEATNNKPAGKNQVIALEILEHLKKTDGDKISVSSWSKECRDAGITKQRFYEVRANLEKSGKIRIQDDFVFSPVTVSGPGPVTVPPLLDSGGDRTVTGITDKVTERTKPLPAVTVTEKGRGVENSTVSNASNGQPDTISPRATTSEEPELAIW
jgi:KaiC/GvpD/RAD55 family RecA-like ATPase